MDPEVLLNRLADSHRGLTEFWSDDGAWLIYQPAFVGRGAFAELDAAIEWKQDAMAIFGRSVPLPRLTAWYGDPGTDYVYSGISNAARSWVPPLADLRAKLRDDLGLAFNGVLANRYADGSQHMGYHADDEPEFGPSPIIASLSFGAERRFLWRKKAKGSPSEKRVLEDGSLLIMGGRLQADYVHALPKASLVREPRINLTFRQLFPPSPYR